MDAPHGGRILRLRHREGDPPTVRGLRGARMRATSPEGVERTFRIESFALVGGRASDARMARTGRADVHVAVDEAAPGTPPIGARWEVTPI